MTTDPILTEIKLIKNIGRFEEAKALPGVKFGVCTLVFGENGWGKSTLADLMRSLADGQSEIVQGRATLGGGINQNAVFLFGTSAARYDDGAWQGHKPKVVVYDSAFINNNVFSGDQVSADHLKNQYGLVVGEEGVRRVRRLVELDEENRACNNALKTVEIEINGIIRSVAPNGMDVKAFLALEQGENVDELIELKKSVVQRAHKSGELRVAAIPDAIPVPTESGTFRGVFERSIDNIGQDAAAAVRHHIEAHKEGVGGAPMSHESWLEAGVTIVSGSDCPFCGQELNDRKLVDAYSSFFGKAYRDLSEAVRKLRATCGRYEGCDFRDAVNGKHKRNSELSQYWYEHAKVELPNYPDVNTVIEIFEENAAKLDAFLGEKQENLTESLTEAEIDGVFTAWEAARAQALEYNEVVTVTATEIAQVKEQLDGAQSQRLENELKLLQTRKRRFEADVIELAERHKRLGERKKAIATDKKTIREELNEHGRSITETLGKSINAYLRRLNAGFRIDYQEPDYRGKEPAASYQILINEQPVSPRTGGNELDKPTFRNTLSGGDKSTLALAFFLARVNANSDLPGTIVVLDDPFTSLDQFRRQFTAIEIRRLCAQAAQTIVLSHDKSFLRLLWEKIDQTIITSIALQTGAPGVSTFAPFNIQEATQPRFVTERMQIEEFVEGEDHEPSYIRTRLRTVCEDFYRKGDPALFGLSDTLEKIIRTLETAADDHPYKAALDDLRDINSYSRADNHAEIGGDPYAETSKEELCEFGRRVLELTRGL